MNAKSKTRKIQFFSISTINFSNFENVDFKNSNKDRLSQSENVARKKKMITRKEYTKYQTIIQEKICKILEKGQWRAITHG